MESVILTPNLSVALNFIIVINNSKRHYVILVRDTVAKCGHVSVSLMKEKVIETFLDTQVC